MKNLILAIVGSFAVLVVGAVIFISVAELVVSGENSITEEAENTNIVDKSLSNNVDIVPNNKNIENIMGSISSMAVSHPINIDEAFDIQFINNAVQINVHDQYKLYRDKLNITVENAEVDKIILPKGKEYKDELIGEDRFVFVGMHKIPLSIINKKDGAVVLVNYQGCWDGGVCYPPALKKFYLK